LTSDAAGYFGYFGATAGPARRGYYSFDIGSWHFISLNSNVDAGPGSLQYAWLQADLAATANTLCTIAYWHHPVFTSGPHGDDPQMTGIWVLLHAAGVELVLAGHDHIYERFAPQDAYGNVDPERGVRAFTAGTAARACIRSVRQAEQRIPRRQPPRRTAPDVNADRIPMGIRCGRWKRARPRRGPLSPLRRNSPPDAHATREIRGRGFGGCRTSA
jgi:hypothetical protein